MLIYQFRISVLCRFSKVKSGIVGHPWNVFGI
jgi:hypothetical protein